MTLNQLILWANALVPAAAAESVLPSISTTQLCKRDIINEAQLEFVRLTKCLSSEKRFTVTASNPTYSIITHIPDFMEFREEGIWHNRSGSTTNWYRVKPTTMRYLDDKFPSWRNQSTSDLVNYYTQDGDTLTFKDTPSYTLTNGFRAYYYAIPSEVSSLTSYPFTNTTESSRLKSYEKVLLVYYESRALGIMGFRDDANNKMLEFYQLCSKSKGELDSRRDIAQDAKARVRTPMSYGNSFRR
jgi:hypothetical protein